MRCCITPAVVTNDALPALLSKVPVVQRLASVSFLSLHTELVNVNFNLVHSASRKLLSNSL